MLTIFPVLYSMFLQLIYFIYNSLYLLIPSPISPLHHSTIFCNTGFFYLVYCEDLLYVSICINLVFFFTAIYYVIWWIYYYLYNHCLLVNLLFFSFQIISRSIISKCYKYALYYISLGVIWTCFSMSLNSLPHSLLLRPSTVRWFSECGLQTVRSPWDPSGDLQKGNYFYNTRRLFTFCSMLIFVLRGA